MGKQYVIDEELANKILDYLDDKPFKEVYEMAEGLMNLKEVVQTPAVPQGAQ